MLGIKLIQFCLYSPINCHANNDDDDDDDDDDNNDGGASDDDCGWSLKRRRQSWLLFNTSLSRGRIYQD